MAQIIITIPDDQIPRILAAYDNESRPGSTTRAEWARQQLMAWVKYRVLEYERQQRIAAAVSEPVEDIEIT